MEESIGKLCNSMAKFCNHLDTSCSALKESVERRPIPLDSASTTFVLSVNRRISAAGGDLNLLDSMSFGTVSFEELLGHCNEVLKKNQNDLTSLQDHLRSSANYIPPLDFDEEDFVDKLSVSSFSPGSGDFDVKDTGVSEDDPLLDDSLNLKKFGISDVSLATIASQADPVCEIEESDFQHHGKSLGVLAGETIDDLNQFDRLRHILTLSIDDYESLPRHMKSLASWEDLTAAVEKMNAYTGTKRKEPDSFRQDEIELLGLGPKARSYLLLLIQMNKLSVVTSDGVICYRIS